MFREEKALPCCGPQKPHHKGLRAKGEVIRMIAERLRKRKEMARLDRILIQPLLTLTLHKFSVF
jgi:hypothetical protein